MENLNKHQLVLVALLVSFVTSLATGIVTVSLMDQMPTNAIRTINQVVEKTIQQVVPEDSASPTLTAAVSSAISPVERITDVVSSVSKSVVRLKSSKSDSVIVLGVVVSNSGVIMADKSSIAELSDYEAVFADQSVVPVSVVQEQVNGDIVFLAPILNAGQSTSSAKTGAYVPAELSNVSSLGQEVLSLSGKSDSVLGDGLVLEFPDTVIASSTSLKPIVTSVPLSKVMPGSPLFDTSGRVVGLRTSSVDGKDGAEFYPVGGLKAVIPKL